MVTFFIISYTELGSQLRDNFNLPKFEFLDNFIGKEDIQLELGTSPIHEMDSNNRSSDSFNGVEFPEPEYNNGSSTELSGDFNETNIEHEEEKEYISNEQNLKITRQCVHCQKMFDPRKGYSFNEDGEIISYQPGYTAKYCSLDCAKQD